MTQASNTNTNVKRVVPFFWVSSLETSLRFYIDGLGFKVIYQWIDEGKLRWCWVELGGAALMLQEFWKEGPEANVPQGKLGHGVIIYFNCEDALALYQEVKARGIQTWRKPFVGNHMWVTPLADPDGYELFFTSPTDVAEETEYV